MKLTINATSAKMGGAATYLGNMLPEMARQLGGGPDVSVTVWAAPGKEADGPYEVRRHPGAHRGGLRRLYFDQWELPRILRREGQDVLYSSANVGPLRCPCRQVLLVRNPIYFSRQYERRMASLGVKAKLRVQRWLTLRAVARADRVLFPTAAMRDMVAEYTGGPRDTWSVAPYGARLDLFHAPPAPIAPSSSRVRLLHVSHYCDQKNVETLLRAAGQLAIRRPGVYHLTMTAGFERLLAGANPHCPSLRQDRRIFDHLAALGATTDLGSVPYEDLPGVYREADIFVFPSYTESFGHPLVEAMASGLPVVAADVPVNREMCGEAALYVAPFDSVALAEAIERLAADPARRRAMRGRGLERARFFSWERHVASLLDAFGYQRGRERRIAA